MNSGRFAPHSRPPDESVTVEGEPCMRIALTQGYFAIVDLADYARVRQFVWCAEVSRRRDGSVRTVYGQHASNTPEGYRVVEKLHRFILGISDPSVEVDHRNGSGLDNRRSNMRVCAHARNCVNVRKRVTSTSGFKGVSWHREKGKWRAHISHEHKTVHLGYFDDPKQAAIAYNKAAKSLHGDFARLNEVA